MRILQVIDNLQMYGGAQRLQVLFAQALSGRDLELTVMSLQDDRNSPIPGVLEQAGARVVYFPGESLVDPFRFRRMTSYIQREAFDVIHTHLTFANILGIAAAGFNHKAAVSSLHNERIQKRRYFGIKIRAETYLLRNVAKEVIAVGHSAAEAHRSRLAGKPIRVVPNAIEIPARLTPEERQLIRAELADNPERPLVVAVGRLVPQKAFHDLIAAFGQVAARFPLAKLLIIGQGHLQPALETQIMEAGLAEQVELLGPRKDVPRLLAACDLFVNSSLWEGLSIAMLEAMAAGLPVVATNVGDAPRLVVDDAGSLVLPGRPDQLADALCSFLADPERMRQAGEKSRRHVVRHHDPVVWANQILDIYQDALNQTPAYSNRSVA